MAVYPCDWSAHRYPQPQQSVYITAARDDGLDSWMLRFCPKHFGAYLELAQDAGALVDEDSQASRNCDRCGVRKDLAVYVKLFPAKAEPVYYATDLCAACWGAVAAHLKVALGRPLQRG